MSAAASSPDCLRNLKALFDEGLLTEAEFTAEKAKFLQQQPAPQQCAPAASETVLQSIAETMQEFVKKLSTTPSPSKRMKHSEFVAVAPEETLCQEPGARSLYSMGVRKLIAKPKQQAKPVKLGFGPQLKCPQCNFTTTKPGPLARHVKTHKIVEPARDQSVLKLFGNQSGVQLSSRQQQRARDVDIAFILRDIVKGAETQAVANLRRKKKKGFLQKHWDGRRCNSGSTRRFSRSYEFKKKVIVDHQRLSAQHPSLVGHISAMVADIHDITTQQVNLWLRDKDSILEKAKGKNRKFTTNAKRKLGLFPAAEAAVFSQFQEARKKGKQVGQNGSSKSWPGR